MGSVGKADAIRYALAHLEEMGSKLVISMESTPEDLQAIINRLESPRRTIEELEEQLNGIIKKRKLEPLDFNPANDPYEREQKRLRKRYQRRCKHR